MSMPEFKRVLAVATAMAAATVVFTTPAATAATPTTIKDAAALTKDLANGDVSAATTYRVMYRNVLSGQCLNQDYTGGTAHHDILAWPCDSSAPNEWWDITLTSAGSWVIKSVASGQCLNQDYTGGTAHHDVLAWPCSSSATNDKWYIALSPTGDSEIVMNAESSQYLNQDYSGGTAHHDVLAWPWVDGARNELWEEIG